jgi:Xaa-Pro aminopeptidase
MELVVNQQNLDFLQDYLRAQGLSAALLSSPFTVAWLTGYAPPVLSGPSPFEGSPVLAWWCDGHLTLVTSDAEANAARATGAEVRDYVAYTIEEPIAGFRGQASTLLEVLKGTAGVRGKIGIEMDFLPASLFDPVQSALPHVAPEPLDHRLDALRAVKSPEEIRKLRAALALCDRAQAKLQAAIGPGVSELELWGAVQADLEIAAGTPLPVLVDLVAGTRSAGIGGLPGAYRTNTGDALIFDVGPRLDGYWGDNCATYFVGEPVPEFARIYEVVQATLMKGIEAVRPGVEARELDALLRESLRTAGYEPHPHHSGHGIGVAYHEEPRLVPYNSRTLEPGMVITLEPGVYVPGVGGVRLENAVLVTQEGCELLTHHLEDH